MLRRKLANSFVMKVLGAANEILAMRITRDRKNRKSMLSQGEYIEEVLQRFITQNEKTISTPLSNCFKLSKEMCQRHRKR